MTSSKITQVVDAILPPLLDMLEMHTLARKAVTSDALRVCLTGALVVLAHNAEPEPVVAKGISPNEVPNSQPGDLVYFHESGHLGYVRYEDLKGMKFKLNVKHNHDGSVVSQLRRDDSITRSFKRNLGYMLYDSLHQHGWVYANRNPADGTLNLDKIVEAICQHIMSFEPTMPEHTRITATEARELEKTRRHGEAYGIDPNKITSRMILDTEGYLMKHPKKTYVSRLNQPVMPDNRVKCTCCGNAISTCRCVSQ